jgi:16S rRNA (uracil1498-N3)-methyltransferase
VTSPGRRWRALAPDAADAYPRVTLDPEETHHLVRVLRARPGDRVDVFDGLGREWVGTFEGGSTVRLAEELVAPVEPPVAITLLQAGTRPERFEWVLQKGTEIGITAFLWIETARVEVEAPSPAKLERWRRIVVESAKQSGRRRVPTLDLEKEWPRPPASPAAFVLHPGAEGIAVALAEPGAARVEVAVGPEGGFEEAEAAALAGLGWVPAGLGPRVLRTETAGPLAAALILHAWGDLGAAGAPVDSGEPRP